MVLLLHWFIPYKVERGKTYFQCGTKEFKPKGMQGNQAKRAKGKEFLSTYNKSMRLEQKFYLVFKKKKKKEYTTLYCTSK